MWAVLVVGLVDVVHAMSNPVASPRSRFPSPNPGMLISAR